jgi:hypothetical protein
MKFTIKNKLKEGKLNEVSRGNIGITVANRLVKAFVKYANENILVENDVYEGDKKTAPKHESGKRYTIHIKFTSLPGTQTVTEAHLSSLLLQYDFSPETLARITRAVNHEI